MVTALEAGAIDAALSPPPKDLERLEKAGVIVGRGQLGVGLWNAVLNPPDPDQPKGPLSDRRVRQAISFAMDRETMVEQALFGLGEPTQVPFPPYSPAYFEDLTHEYDFDLDRAAQLLAEAGYPDGGFELRVITGAAMPGTPAMAQILQDDVAELGITLNIEVLDQGVYTTRRFGFENNGSGDYDIDFTGGGLMHLDPLGLFLNSPFRVYDSPIFPRGDFPEGYEEAVTGIGLTVDKEERRALLRQIQEIMLEECVNVSIAWNFGFFAWQPYVKGFDWSTSNAVQVANTWLDR
jgi:ABC-type transport system substrate-binding protein